MYVILASDMTLNDLKVTEAAVVLRVGGEGSLRQHFLDMGIIPGAEVRMMGRAPMGDPLELQIHGYALTLRNADAAQIEVARLVDARLVRVHLLGEPGTRENERQRVNVLDVVFKRFAAVGCLRRKRR